MKSKRKRAFIYLDVLLPDYNLFFFFSASVLRTVHEERMDDKKTKRESQTLLLITFNGLAVEQASMS